MRNIYRIRPSLSICESFVLVLPPLIHFDFLPNYPPIRCFFHLSFIIDWLTILWKTGTSYFHHKRHHGEWHFNGEVPSFQWIVNQTWTKKWKSGDIFVGWDVLRIWRDDKDYKAPATQGNQFVFFMCLEKKINKE